MPSEPKRPKSRDRLSGLVDETVSVLDQKRAGEESQAHTIESPAVRAALRRNRQYGDLPLKHIEPDPEQVRRVDTTSENFKELVASIREHGVIEPITVRWIEDREVFQIITGERRFRAASHLKLETIPAIVRDLTDSDKSIHQLVENIQRENMNPVDEAKAFYRYLAATGETHDQLARRIGKSRPYVTQMMTLLEKLTLDEQQELAGCSPANIPGKTLILEALRVDDSETRHAILFGQMTRQEARQAVKERTAKPRGRPKNASKTFRTDDPPATITVRLSHPDLDQQAVWQALHAATEAQRRALEGDTEV